MSNYHARMVGEEMGLLHERIAELEAALTDALYAWGLVSNVLRPYHFPLSDSQQAEVKEAEERIQRARLALPKAQEVTG